VEAGYGPVFMYVTCMYVCMTKMGLEAEIQKLDITFTAVYKAVYKYVA